MYLLRLLVCIILVETAVLYADKPEDERKKQKEHKQHAPPPQQAAPVPPPTPPPPAPTPAPAPAPAPQPPPPAPQPVPQIKKPQPQPQKPVPQIKKPQPQPQKPVPPIQKHTPMPGQPTSPAPRPVPQPQIQTPQPQQPSKGQPQRTLQLPSRSSKPQTPPPNQAQAKPSSRRPRTSLPQTPAVPRSPSLSQLPVQQTRHDRRKLPEKKSQTVQDLKQKAHSYMRRRETPRNTEELQSVVQERVRNHEQTARQVSSHVKRNHRGYREWFNKKSFREHNYYPSYWNDHTNWWRGASWGRVHHWLGWGPTVYPIYYDVGIYPITITQVDIDQEIYQNEPPVAIEGTWLPLGVFALGSDTTQASYSNLFVQIALNQKGEIAGTYYNATTDMEYALEGEVDIETQQLYFSIAEATSSQIITTGLYNITLDVVPIQMTFQGGIAQNWVLVRLNE